MSEIKTKKNDKSVDEFINSSNPKFIEDSKILLKIFREVSRDKGSMWGDSIIGFGTWIIKYADGKELKWPKIGFSPRKNYIALYVMEDKSSISNLLEKLGKHKSTKACIYINKMKDIDSSVLKQILKRSFDEK